MAFGNAIENMRVPVLVERRNALEPRRTTKPFARPSDCVVDLQVKLGFGTKVNMYGVRTTNEAAIVGPSAEPLD